MVKKNIYKKHIDSNFLVHPVIFATIICVFFIYCRPFGFSIPNNYFSCAIFPNEICLIQGKVKGNPVKIDSKYKISVQTQFCGDKKNTLVQSFGCIDAYIPATYVERWYPGKLYSINTFVTEKDANLPIEDGTTIILKGSFSKKNIFFTDSIRTSAFSNGIIGKISYFRAYCRIQFKRLMFAWGEAGGLLLALLSGSREYTDKSLADAFKSAGLSHIMALSGMHLSLFSSIAVFLGKKIKNQRITFLLQCIFILFFVWFAGVSPSLFRALLCSFLLLICSFTSVQTPNSLYILGVAFLLHAFFIPEHLFSPAFILSYGALCGILIVGDIIQPLFRKNLPDFTSSNISSSIGAQIFTAPYTLHIFKTFMPVCTVATLIVSPAVSIFMYTGLVCIILSFILPFLSPVFSAIMGVIYFLIKIPVLFFAKMPAITV